MVLRPIPHNERLADVRYDIRGPLHARALDLEQQGKPIIRLNIGNPGRFGFEAPEHVREAIARHLRDSEAYCHQQGLTEAREAIVQVMQARGIEGVDINHVFIGNGVSELIDLSLRGLLNPGDEVLVPAPDYPLWTAAVILNDGQPVHYPCPPERQGLPDPVEIERMITPRTRAIVVINPNNPNGAVYPKALLQAIAALAEKHRLVVFSDEIYEGLLYDGAEFHPMAPLVQNSLCITMSGLSKMHRACGYRVGWMVTSGRVQAARDYLRSLDLLAALRLCSNVQGQWAIPAALQGPDTHTALCQPGGRLYETRAALLRAVGRSRHLQVAAPMGAMYGFVGVRVPELPGFDDQQFALDLLDQRQVLIVPGSSFNVPYRNHFRITLLPEAALMERVIDTIDQYVSELAERARPRVAQVA
ncbi:MAG: aminotransferase class I/II-fold pyridoxal phosphate-dependent enzyme [Lysobacterales bacterium]